MSIHFWERIVAYLIEFSIIIISMLIWYSIKEIKFNIKYNREQKLWIEESVPYNGGRIRKTFYDEKIATGWKPE